MNTIQEIAYKVRQHYYEGFLEEYHQQKMRTLQLSNGDKSFQSQLKIETDCILNPDYKKNVRLMDIDNRPSDQIDLEDYGWYILTGIPTKTKELLMKSIDNDTITNIEIDDDDYLVTTTTMDEQNNKSYYTANKILDTVLFPNEKISMMFELVNQISVIDEN